MGHAKRPAAPRHEPGAIPWEEGMGTGLGAAVDESAATLLLRKEGAKRCAGYTWP